MGMVKNKFLAYPVVTLLGAGVRVLGQLHAFPQGIFEGILAVPARPVWGAGVPSGTVDMYMLMEQEEATSEGLLQTPAQT
jgi:hypothetical protein